MGDSLGTRYGGGRGTLNSSKVPQGRILTPYPRHRSQNPESYIPTVEYLEEKVVPYCLEYIFRILDGDERLLEVMNGYFSPAKERKLGEQGIRYFCIAGTLLICCERENVGINTLMPLIEDSLLLMDPEPPNYECARQAIDFTKEYFDIDII